MSCIEVFHLFVMKMTTTANSAIHASGKLIVVANRLPFVLKRNEVSGKWERKARFVVAPVNFYQHAKCKYRPYSLHEWHVVLSIIRDTTSRMEDRKNLEK